MLVPPRRRRDGLGADDYGYWNLEAYIRALARVSATQYRGVRVLTGA